MRLFIGLLLLCFSIKAEIYSFKDSQHLLTEAYEASTLKLGEPEKKAKYDFFEGELFLIESASSTLLKYDFHFYYPKELKHPNLIVLTPNIDGVTILERSLARYLVKRGFPVVVPLERTEETSFDEQTAFRMERKVRRAMAGTFHLINLLKKDFPRIDTNSMGVTGASLGGIRSSILFGLDERFKAAFIAVAGSNIPFLYEITTMPRLVEFRQRHMEALGISDVQDYSAYLRKFLFLEPNLITRSPNLENVALIISNNDDVVPTPNQWQLFSRIKDAGVHPKTYTTEKGHVLAALELLLKRDDVLEWFIDRL